MAGNASNWIKVSSGIFKGQVVYLSKAQQLRIRERELQRIRDVRKFNPELESRDPNVLPPLMSVIERTTLRGGMSGEINKERPAAAARRPDLTQELSDDFLLTTFQQASDPFAAVVALRGFSNAPQVVSRAQLDAQISAGAPELIRGMYGDRRHAAQYRGGEHFLGYGAYGRGTYFADTTPGRQEAIQMALGFAGIAPDGTAFAPGGSMLRATLQPSARVISYRDLLPQVQAERAALTERITRGQATEADRVRLSLTDDMGVYATAGGYDAIHIGGNANDGASEYVVLNRGAMLVQRESPLKSAIATIRKG